MRVKISPSSSLKGSLVPPSSKSHTLRALLFASLAQGISRIENPLIAKDSLAMKNACLALGAEIEGEEKTLLIKGTGGKFFTQGEVIDAKDSGIVLRFISAIGALQEKEIFVTGTKELCEKRSNLELIKALRQLGAKVRFLAKEGFAPFILQGPITGAYACLEGCDSQPVSALLIALSFLDQVSVLEVINPGETPWIDMTLKWLLQMGKKIEHEGYRRYTIFGSSRPMASFTYRIPIDFSSLAFPLVASVLQAEEVCFQEIDFSDVQGDKKLIPLLKEMGAEITFQESGCLVRKSCLKGVEIDINDMIDALPILTVACTFAKGTSVLYNAEVARSKESDRLTAISEELRKMGAKIEEGKDRLLVTSSSLKGSVLHAHGDHRIAMALSVAALSAEGESIIEGYECIAKTYPLFIAHLQSLGASMEELL